MGKVVAQISMSLDGFIAGPDASQENPIGTNGDKLHEWIFDNPERENAFASSLKKSAGAAIIGYNMYYEAIPHWGGTGALGPDIPNFVLTEAGKVPEDASKVFTFVTEGIESALEQAQAAANGKDVWVGGGGKTIQQYLKAGLLDELHIHLVPVLLGGGTTLFGKLGKFIDLKKVEVKDEPHATHFIFRFK